MERLSRWVVLQRDRSRCVVTSLGGRVLLRRERQARVCFVGISHVGFRRSRLVWSGYDESVEPVVSWRVLTVPWCLGKPKGTGW